MFTEETTWDICTSQLCGSQRAASLDLLASFSDFPWGELTLISDFCLLITLQESDFVTFLSYIKRTGKYEKSIIL